MARNTSIESSIATWSDTFKRWSKPFSDSEEAKADNAASIIRGTLDKHPPLAEKNIDVYATGSYHNNTNVRGESDIDVAAVCHDTIFYDLPDGMQAQKFGLTAPATYTFASFRSDVHDALLARFGSSGMTPGDKGFNIHENTYRIEADVTPFFEYRKYDGKATAQGSWAYREGVKSISESGTKFVNWHHDHYDQGVKRNAETGKCFKRVTRIMKNMKFDMIENGTPQAKDLADQMPSFLIECLVFNAKDTCFQHDDYVEDVRYAIADMWARTKQDGDWKEMVEVNWRKWLFRSGQAWKVETVHDFLGAAWGYLFHE